MDKKMDKYKTADGMVLLRVLADGSKAEMRVEAEADLVSAGAITELLTQAGIKYGFKNAREKAVEEGAVREVGKYFTIALADDSSFEPEVEILVEPLDCLLSQRLYSINDLARVRFINAGEKLAKVKTGSGSVQSRNIFDRKIRDLAADKNFLDTYLGENVEFDTRRNLIVASNDGYALVENGKKISIIDNIFLQQDIIETGFEIKSSLTLEGSVFSSDLVVNGNLVVSGKIEDCKGKGVVVAGNLVLDSSENSLLICKGNLEFRDQLQNCEVYCNGNVKGAEKSEIIGGNIQSGISIISGKIGNEEKENTIVEVSIAPFIKGMMIQLSQELRKKDWDPSEPEMEDPLVKELSQLEIRFSKVIPDFLSSNRELNKITSRQGFYPGVALRIFNLCWEIDTETGETEFALLQD
ncbi:MAG: FapA family protein [Candidatus Cloacimonetes bacterium]|nr:FapA family protein [Candidatus Cloacimonadota bacterium]